MNVLILWMCHYLLSDENASNVYAIICSWSITWVGISRTGCVEISMKWLKLQDCGDYDIYATY